MNEDQGNKWNLKLFFYLIKDLSKVINFFDFIWYFIRKFIFLLSFQITLLVIFALANYPLFGSFVQINIQKTNHNNNQMSLMSVQSPKHFTQNKDLLNNANSVDNSIVSYINRQEEINNYLDKVSIFINLYRIILILIIIFFSILLFYIFKLLPTKEDYKELENTELSWWNPLSIWYGICIRIFHSSIFSRILWFMFYLFLGFRIFYQIKFLISMIMLIKFSSYLFIQIFYILLNYIYFPRWYSPQISSESLDDSDMKSNSSSSDE